MTEPTITVYGAYWCPDCHRSKQFLGEHQIPYRWVDIEQDPVGEAYVLQRAAWGGQAAAMAWLDNVPGFADGIDGATAALLIREYLKSV